MTPMNDTIACKTIEDHRYLLELVENRTAIAFFAVSNRNQSLFNALQKFCKDEDEEIEDEDLKAKD